MNLALATRKSTHPQLNPVISHGWIKKGEDFEVLTHNSSRYHLNINGAVENLDVVTRRFERVNTASICELVRAIRDNPPRRGDDNADHGQRRI